MLYKMNFRALGDASTSKLYIALAFDFRGFFNQLCHRLRSLDPRLLFLSPFYFFNVKLHRTLSSLWGAFTVHLGVYNVVLNIFQDNRSEDIGFIIV